MQFRFLTGLMSGAFLAILPVVCVHASCPFNLVTGAQKPVATQDGLAAIRVARGATAGQITNGLGVAAAAENSLLAATTTRAELDVDCNGAFTVTDAVIIARHALGFRGDALLTGLTITGRRNTAPLIEAFIADSCPLPSGITTTANLLSPFATDNCTHAAPIMMNRWSQPATWGGMVPVAGSHVVIPVGKTIVLDVATAALASLKIEGALTAEQGRDVGITAGYVLVTGPSAVLEIGNVIEPFLGKALITLTGSATSGNPLVPALGNKVLGVMGGTLRLHGKPSALNWTQLIGGDLAAGARTLQLESAPGWLAGDEVVIATSSLNMNDYTAGKIESISGNQLTLTAPTTKSHFAAKRVFAGVTVDVRAEIGRLSHNIVVQGDDGSTASQIGGHSMFMDDGPTTVQLANVEYRRMGQLNQLGRYPVHFHLMKDRCVDCYVRDVSVNGSIQRGIVVHGTQNIQVSGNVSFNTPGHNFVIEDTEARNNVFTRNLAVANVQPTPALTEVTLVRQNDKTPANFWINGGRNVLRGNRAAGAFSAGYIFDGVVDGPSVFEDNAAHAAMNRGGDVFPLGSGLTLLMGRRGLPGDRFTGLTSYHNDNGFWSENDLFAMRTDDPPIVNRDFVYYDNRQNIFVRSPGSRSLSDRPTVIAGPLTQSSEFSRNQYGGQQELRSPTAVNFNGGLATSIDAHPGVASYVISDVRRINSTLEPVPSDQTRMTYLDSSMFPIGTYYPEAAVASSNPSCTNVSVSPPSSGDTSRYYRCETASVVAELDVRLLSTPLVRTHMSQDIRRSDGLVFRSLGDRGPPQPFMFQGGVLGYSVVLGTPLTYAIDTRSASGYSMRLDVSLETALAEVVSGDGAVEITVATAAAPSAVYREGLGENPPAVDTLAGRLTLANSLADFRANARSKYWYEASANRVWVSANKFWLTIRP